MNPKIEVACCVCQKNKCKAFEASTFSRVKIAESLGRKPEVKDLVEKFAICPKCRENAFERFEAEAQAENQKYEPRNERRIGWLCHAASCLEEEAASVKAMAKLGDLFDFKSVAPEPAPVTKLPVKPAAPKVRGKKAVKTG